MLYFDQFTKFPIVIHVCTVSALWTHNDRNKGDISSSIVVNQCINKKHGIYNIGNLHVCMHMYVCVYVYYIVLLSICGNC